MRSKIRLNLNLAESPLKNKNLFYFLLFFLGGISILWLILSLAVFFNYRQQNNDAKRALTRIENRISYERREERRYLTRVNNFAKENYSKANFINHLIMKKSFSWTQLLTALEKALPDNCYIVSLSPLEKGDSTSELRFQVASSGLEPFFRFVNNLYALDFSDFRLIREGKDNQGNFIAEISLNYGKTD